MKYGKVSMFTFISGDTVFLQERGLYSKRGEEWSFFGGHLEADEDFLTGLKREVQEELSIDIEVEDIEDIGEFSNIIQGVSNYYSHIFICRSYEKYFGNIKIQEGSAGKFFSFQDAYKLKMFSHDYMVLDNIERFLKNEKN